MRNFRVVPNTMLEIRLFNVSAPTLACFPTRLCDVFGFAMTNPADCQESNSLQNMGFDIFSNITGAKFIFVCKILGARNLQNKGAKIAQRLVQNKNREYISGTRVRGIQGSGVGSLLC